MICCTNCFCDLEIKATIESLNHKGQCPICGSSNIWIYDSENDADASSFEEMLSSVIEIYKPEEELENSYPENDKKSIEEHICNDWNIFNVDMVSSKTIITYIVESSLFLDGRILNQKVGIPEKYDEAYLEENSILGKYTWTDFKKYLRNENRFHNNYINLRVLSEVLRDTISEIPEGERFYRARIANDKFGFSSNEMGAPPDDVASAGRANSKGISCLYLANKKKTTVKEIRASAFDYVTIATFKLLKKVTVVDLSVITHNSPFYASTDKVKYLINEKHLKEIEQDLAKPVGSRDSDLDYLPTQYISDFAKFLGYDGVKYISTFDNESFNLALFHKDICKCTYRRTFLIGDLDYRLNAL